ncbi:MAG: DUF1326 domain-containing protein [Actinomycetota bacterium]|nr:DUF1326 domain-containing protein [Actinomycetota bacterium]
MAYEMSGTFLEACDCHALCPCWLDRAPDDGECTGVFAWEVDAGQVDDVDVAGCSVASVSYHSGHRHDAHQRVVLFVDEGVTDEQAARLADVFAGKLGGPLGELGRLLGQLADVRRAAIELAQEGEGVRLSIGTRVRADVRAIRGATGRPITIEDGALADVLGSPATIGESRRYRVDLPGQGMDVDVRARSAAAGQFHYRHSDTGD